MTFDLRPLREMDEFRACVALQERVWGAGFGERVGVSLLRVARRLGGVAEGAWDEHGLAGFVFGLTGPEGDRLVHWSDMLAVRPDVRGAGLGTRLKLRQRELLLALGIDVCYWTFDPLVARNAHLNLEKLGAVVREYVVDMYGDSPSPLHRGIGTDRFVALWELDSERVRLRLSGAGEGDEARSFEEAGRGESAVTPAFEVVRRGAWPVPGEVATIVPGEPIRVPVPGDIGALMEADTELASAWRKATREAFAGRVGLTHEVVAIETGEPVSHYVLEPLAARERT